MIKKETQEDFIIRRKRTKRPKPLPTSSCSTGSPRKGGEEEEEDMANCLILLAQSCSNKSSPEEFMKEPHHNVYQCKTCNRSFHSFQALGGHRASHKKPKPENLESSNLDQLREEQSTMLSLQIPNGVFSCNNTSNTSTKHRVHECSICGAEFNSGQALGGHMRRHRPIPIVPRDIIEKEFSSHVKKQRTFLSLDLNLPAPDEDDQIQIDRKFPFPATNEQVIVFSAHPLVDCHYY